MAEQAVRFRSPNQFGRNASPSANRSIASNASTLPAILSVSYHIPIDGDRVMSSQDVATLSSKFQISIPKAIRSAWKWQPGQKFAFIPRDGGVMLVPVLRWEELAGSMPEANTEAYRDRNDRF
jgi:AbrB family looped-hinge helix DNA binding protein